MKTLQNLIDQLDSQCTILNIEGFQSSLRIYNVEEIEYKETKCWRCNGWGTVVDEWHHGDCPDCGGECVILEPELVTHERSEMHSNILI